MDYYLEWLQTRFMEAEVSKVSYVMAELFKRCKRKPEQSVRDFNVEFERLVLRLHELRCELPALVKAWLYVDKLRLSENEEVSLLASVNNEYDVRPAPAGSSDTRPGLEEIRPAPGALYQPGRRMEAMGQAISACDGPRGRRGHV